VEHLSALEAAEHSKTASLEELSEALKQAHEEALQSLQSEAEQALA